MRGREHRRLAHEASNANVENLSAQRLKINVSVVERCWQVWIPHLGRLYGPDLKIQVEPLPLDFERCRANETKIHMELVSRGGGLYVTRADGEIAEPFAVVALRGVAGDDWPEQLQDLVVANILGVEL